ncbi:MAG: DUF3014 domain-containing protein [Myxococcota bacterium]
MPELESESETLNAILQRRRARRIGLGAALTAVAVLGAAGWWLLFREGPRPPPPPSRPAPVVKAPTRPLPPTPPPPLPVEEIVVVEQVTLTLPPLAGLEASDSEVREAALALSEHAAWADFLLSQALIRQFVVVVDNLAEGKSPVGPLSVLRPKRPYRATWEGETLRVDPDSWPRYDAVGLAVSVLNARGAVALLEIWQPRIDEAYRDLGYPERPFSAALAEAFNQLLSAPVIEGLPLLVPEGVDYAYADPLLEALSPAQKHLLRMGPVNTRRVQDKLRELARRLGIPDHSLPRKSVYRASSPD